MVRLRKGFFGTKTGNLFDSGPDDSPTIYLTFIKKKQDGSWEKPSLKEGKAIKFTLVDIAFMLRVFRGEVTSWKTFHSFEGRETHISFERGSQEKEDLNVKAGDYLKQLNYGEIEVFKAMLDHAFHKKVITPPEIKKREEILEPKQPLPEGSLEQLITETGVLTGTCKGETEKALLIEFEGNKEIWIPKSTIRSNFDPNSTQPQKIEIDSWILKKNNII